jgi:membrane-associated phospholipid phosphatase
MDLVLQLQTLTSPLLDKLMYYFTELGSTKFYLLAMPIVYWCISRRSGYYIGITVLFGGCATNLAKSILLAPRPFELNPAVLVSEDFLSTAIGTGMPSGHSFNSMAFWLASSMQAKKIWLWSFSTILILIIGFTRIYSGVHFPLQVLWGWLGGAALALVIHFVLNHCEYHLESGLAGAALSIGVLVPILYAAIPNLRQGLGDYANLIGLAGGLSLGYYLHEKFVKTDAKGIFVKQALKLLIGFTVFFALKEGADMLAESKGFLLLPLYFLLGLWPAAGATAVFKLLHLEVLRK